MEKRIFSEALDLERTDRTDYLDRVCAGNDGLRLRVGELLCAHDDASGNFER